jgi:choline dehydrogenase-like flavoprotein
LDCFRAHRTDIDWAYLTAPQQNLSGRSLYSPAGALGGGSAINYGTWLRGPARDYDTWAKCVADRRWSYDGLLPYFQRCEYQVSRSDDAGRQETGAIHVVPISQNRSYPLREPLLAAWREIGKAQNNHSTTQSTLGVNEMWENWREGKRQLASTAYDLSKVEVLTGRAVSKVLIDDKDGRKIAWGIEITTGEIYRSRKEVIICTGAYRTPHLLMLSGIGPATELAKHNIETKVDNSFVGREFDCKEPSPSFPPLLEPPHEVLAHLEGQRCVPSTF